jgi:hypothetical protein
VGVLSDNGKWVTVMMPAGARLEVASENLDNGTVDIIWNDQRVTMFSIDLLQRGAPLKAKREWKAVASE